MAAGLSANLQPQQNEIVIKSISDAMALSGLAKEAALWIKKQFDQEPARGALRSIISNVRWHPLNHAPVVLVVASKQSSPCSDVVAMVTQNLMLSSAQEGLAVRWLGLLLDWCNTEDGRLLVGISPDMHVGAVIGIGVPATNNSQTSAYEGGTSQKVNLPQADSMLNALRKYHLTPSGWQRADDPPFPEDRVETLLCEVDEPEEDGAKLSAVTPLWVSPKLTRSQRDELHFEFGESPQEIEHVGIMSNKG